jgi:hypothetical protein
MIEFQTIGADPEFALRKNNINVPSFHYFQGTKQQPEDKGNGFAILKDNLLIEGNIPPVTRSNRFVNNIRLLKELIESVTHRDSTRIYYQDVVKFNKRFIMTEDGMDFGCSSYVNAWDRETHSSPQLFDTFYRPVGAHIHLGYKLQRDDIDPAKMNEWLARAYDYFVNLPADTINFSKERRENYGQLGSYRDTEYGIEFRGLGGFFMQDHYLHWIFNQTIKTVEFCKSIENCEKLDNLEEPLYDNYDILDIDLLEQVPGGNNLLSRGERLLNNMEDNIDAVYERLMNERI